MRVGVIGGGLMGSGIAEVCARSGVDVTVVEADDERAERSRAAIERSLARAVKSGKLDEDGKTTALEHLAVTAAFDDIEGVDAAIEAVVENEQLKRDVFRRLDALLPDAQFLASNTSSVPIMKLGAETKHPGRVLGMHFFNPVPKMKLVEIVRALDTSDAAIAATAEVARRMGKETVVVKESPGFITSRINAMIGNEAFLILQEGVATAADIDKAVKLGLNHPMGPFEMADLVGLDTRLAVLEFLHKSLGEKYRPAPLLVEHVKAGRLGRKVGRGVYDYGEKS